MRLIRLRKQRQFPPLSMIFPNQSRQSLKTINAGNTGAFVASPMSAVTGERRDS